MQWTVGLSPFGGTTFQRTTVRRIGVREAVRLRRAEFEHRRCEEGLTGSASVASLSTDRCEVRWFVEPEHEKAEGLRGASVPSLRNPKGFEGVSPPVSSHRMALLKSPPPPALRAPPPHLTVLMLRPYGPSQSAPDGAQTPFPMERRSALLRGRRAVRGDITSKTVSVWSQKSCRCGKRKAMSEHRPSQTPSPSGGHYSCKKLFARHLPPH